MTNRPASLTSAVAPQARVIAGAVGAGLVYSAASNTCAMAAILGRLPYNRSATCDVAQTVVELVAAAEAQEGARRV